MCGGGTPRGVLVLADAAGRRAVGRVTSGAVSCPATQRRDRWKMNPHFNDGHRRRLATFLCWWRRLYDRPEGHRWINACTLSLLLLLSLSLSLFFFLSFLLSFRTSYEHDQTPLGVPARRLQYLLPSFFTELLWRLTTLHRFAWRLTLLYWVSGFF